MKRIIYFIMVWLISGWALADAGPNLVVNGNFETSGGWSQWWGGNSSLTANDPVESDVCGGVWWNDDGIYQNLGELAAGTYEFGGKLLATGGLANQKVVIQADMDDGSTTWTQRLAVTESDAEDIWHSKTSAVILSESTTVTLTLMLADAGSSPSGIGLFDDIYFHRSGESDPVYYGAKLEPQNLIMHTAGQSVGDFNDYWNVMDADERPACYMAYCNLVTPFVPALREDLERYKRDYGVYLPVQLGLYIVGIEDKIAAGLWDADIERFCRDLNQLGYPLYIRIGYECNGAHNNYDPTAYKAAFIRITNALRANNVETATVFNVIQGPYTAWYPGDDYVDWMSINAFSVWNVQHPDTYTFLNDAHARSKPVMIGEADPTWWHTDQGQASWDGYFVPYFNLIESWPGIKNFCYINADWTTSDLPDWGDCRLQPYPDVAQLYRDRMDSALYLHGTDEISLRTQITDVTDTTPPGRVTGITVNTAGQAPVALAWNRPADDTGINRYEICRDGVLAGYQRAEYFEDRAVTAGQTYRYQITAIDEGGNRGPASDSVMAVTAGGIEKIVNGEFNEGRGPWTTSWNAGGLSMTSSIDTTSKLSGENSCKFDIGQVTGTDWHLQYVQNLDTHAGFVYELTYTAVADRNTTLTAALQETHSPYNSFIVHTADLTTQPQTFTISGTAPDEDNVNLTFLLGGSAPRIIWLDAISVTEISNDPDPQTCADVYHNGFELSADLTGDCSVNIQDLVYLIDRWLRTDCSAANGDCEGADLQLNGAVDMTDLAVISLEWLECNNPQDCTCYATW